MKRCLETVQRKGERRGEGRGRRKEKRGERGRLTCHAAETEGKRSRLPLSPEVLWLVLASESGMRRLPCPPPPCQPSRSTRRRRSAMLSWDSSACPSWRDHDWGPFANAYYRPEYQWLVHSTCVSPRLWGAAVQVASEWCTRQYQSTGCVKCESKSRRLSAARVTSVGQPPASGRLGSREADPGPSFKLRASSQLSTLNSQLSTLHHRLPSLPYSTPAYQAHYSNPHHGIPTSHHGPCQGVRALLSARDPRPPPSCRRPAVPAPTPHPHSASPGIVRPPRLLSAQHTSF